MPTSIVVRDADGVQQTVATIDALLADFTATAAADTNRLPVDQRDCAITSASVTSATTLVSLDTTGYGSISVQVTSAGTSCTVTYEQSNDNTNWLGCRGHESNGVAYSQTPALTTTTLGLFTFSKNARYFRARVSTYGSGTVSVVAALLRVERQNAIEAVTGGGAIEGSGLGTSNFPTITGFESRTSSKTSVNSGSLVRAIATQDGRQVVRPHAIPENTITYAAASGGILNTTTAVTMFAAAGANIRNYLCSLQISSEALTNATEVVIRDGAGGTVLWRSKIGTAGWLDGREFEFSVPLRGSANTLMEVCTLSASGAGAVYVNAQGYIAP
jgi:hypothetical protein